MRHHIHSPYRTGLKRIAAVPGGTPARHRPLRKPAGTRTPAIVRRRLIIRAGHPDSKIAAAAAIDPRHAGGHRQFAEIIHRRHR
jgi:hypothetical protein